MDLRNATREEIHRQVYLKYRWTKLRKQIVREHGYHCENCGYRRKSKYLIVHHKVPIRDGGDAWDRTNLALLCRKCHFLEHGRQGWMRKPKPSKSQIWKTQYKNLENSFE